MYNEVNTINAPKGGCFGENGVFYKGGQFVNQSGLLPDPVYTITDRDYTPNGEHGESYALKDAAIRALRNAAYIARSTEKSLWENINAQGMEFAHIGTVGEKVTASVRVTDRYSYTGYYGRKTSVTLVTEDGNEIRWTTSATAKDARALIVGASVRISAVVKRHGTARDKKWTEVTRLKVV